MGVITTYDEKRYELQDKLNECVELARELLNENAWGYEDMRKDYAIDVYMAVKKARDTV